MTYVSEHRRIPQEGRVKEKLYLILRCDQCEKQFEQGNNVKIIKSRPRHYCGSSCHATAMKAGGIADASRKKTCQQKYGSDYLVTRSDIASASGKKAHTPEIETKRWKKIHAGWANNSTTLTRGLTLQRSTAEIKFFTHLVEVVGNIECPKYVNGWFVDGYITQHDVWVQFDGVYWHSKPNAQKRDLRQDEWFRTNNKILVRVTDVEWRQDPESCLSRVISLCKK